MAAISHDSIMEMGRYQDLSVDGVDPALVQDLHRFMLRLRRLEEAIMEEYHPADEMRCPVHFCIGQEAVPAALSLLLTPKDFMFSHHRSHGYYLAKNAPMRALMAELYGRETGANGGRAGSQDISMSSVNFYSGAILAGSVSIAVGSALGIQLRGEDGVAVAGFGEGASDEGIFWEAINYAALRKLPVVFMCENNAYATYSASSKRQAPGSISQRVAAFGVESEAIFGNDVINVHAAVEKAITRARQKNGGPYLIEAFTYRWNGHVGPEDDDYLEYRPMAELDFWKDNCPIKLLEEKMSSAGLLTADAKLDLVKEIDAEIADAFEFSKNSPFPSALDWSALNYSADSPVADRLLQEVQRGVQGTQFDQNQPDTMPKPY